MNKPRFRDNPDAATIGRIVLLEERADDHDAAIERIAQLESRIRFLEERLIQLTRPRETLTIQEAAETLGLSARTLARWRNERQPRIPYVSLDGIIRYRVDDIERFLNSREHGVKPALRAA
jgi:hypothetical protein